MKIAIASTIALAAAQKGEKKVPPRHPTQRLAKLGVFYENFFAEMAEQGLMKQREADRRAARAEGFLDSMERAFNRKNCGYYSGEGKHGGPDPNPEIKPNGKPRNRRTADNEEDLTEDAIAWCQDEVTDSYMVQGEWSEKNWLECCQLDKKLTEEAGSEEDIYGFCQGKKRSGASNGNKKAYDRLSDNTSLKWRQITTGTRKWAQRYINNCNGQRKNKLASKRANRMYQVVYKKYFE